MGRIILWDGSGDLAFGGGIYGNLAGIQRLFDMRGENG